MTLYKFNLLPYDRQLVAVFDAGHKVATRWEEEDWVNLYWLPGGIFVELYYDTHLKEITQLKSFTSSDPLGDYAAYVQLPEEL
ncbi:hypothetical protein [Hymenobacter ruricola]|uniref:Uncharacterized protein n=1 Tax=Hymenobacter ruricola TaxID=2791023 RepID=A0ABS0I4D6_9BACT|nr:hypothetical protein [Hymenobacter ruricola]MBF9221765.1 hypothetical protein [Hymenobacter ruricola]